MATFPAVRHVFHTAAILTADGNACLLAGLATVAVQVEGVIGDTVTFEGTIDATTWYAIQAMNVATGAVATTATADGLYIASVAGLEQFRARLTRVGGTVTATGRAVSVGGNMSVSDVAGTVTLLANSGVDIGDVDVTSIAAGETHLGQVGGEGKTIALTPTITAGAYSAGDAVGGLLTFANAGRASAEGSVLTDVLLIDDAGQDAELELWLFDRTFGAIADNGAWAPTEADLENCIAVVSTVDGTWRAAGTPSVINIEVTRRIDITGTSLFGQIVTRGTPTYAAVDDLTVKIQLLQD